jgi:imidazolonepropionase-like amidohydrolase
LAGSAKARAAVANNKENLKTLHDAGVRIAFGSDSGVGLRFPGVAEHRELALSVEAGLTPMQALTLATSNAAGLWKLEDRGVLAVGKLANLSVLDDDPTADIGNSKRIHAVWHRGKQAAGPVEMFTP